MKVVINIDFGGFSLSPFACEALQLDPETQGRDFPREHPHLVALVEIFGSCKIGGSFADLRVVEIPDDIDWYIHEYDGKEHVAEVHRTWR